MMKGIVLSQKMKGQSIVFENMLVFAISVALFVVLVAVFLLQQDVFAQQANLDQADAVKEHVVTALIRASNQPGDVLTTITIPRNLGGGDEYWVLLEQDGLVISAPASNLESSSGLYGLNESFVFSGNVAGREGKIRIEKIGSRLSIS